MELYHLLENVNGRELQAGRKQGCVTEEAVKGYRTAFSLVRSHLKQGSGGLEEVLTVIDQS